LEFRVLASLPLVGLLDTRSRTLHGFWAGRFLSFFERKRASSLLAHDALEPTTYDCATRLPFRSRAPGVSKGLVAYRPFVPSFHAAERRARRDAGRQEGTSEETSGGKVGCARQARSCLRHRCRLRSGRRRWPHRRYVPSRHPCPETSLSLIRPSRSCVAAIDLFAKHHKRPAASGWRVVTIKLNQLISRDPCRASCSSLELRSPPLWNFADSAGVTLLPRAVTLVTYSIFNTPKISFLKHVFSSSLKNFEA
jgi:hypothetical protein